MDSLNCELLNPFNDGLMHLIDENKSQNLEIMQSYRILSSERGIFPSYHGSIRVTSGTV